MCKHIYKYKHKYKYIYIIYNTYREKKNYIHGLAMLHIPDISRPALSSRCPPNWWPALHRHVATAADLLPEMVQHLWELLEDGRGMQKSSGWLYYYYSGCIILPKGPSYVYVYIYILSIDDHQLCYIMLYHYHYPSISGWWLVWTPLKNMTSSIGMISNPIYININGKIKFMATIHHQPVIWSSGINSTARQTRLWTFTATSCPVARSVAR